MSVRYCNTAQGIRRELGPSSHPVPPWKARYAVLVGKEACKYLVYPAMMEYVFIFPCSPALKHVVQEDLSGGLELYPIRVWNSRNRETVPPFEYIKTIETFPNYQRTPVVSCPLSCSVRYVWLETASADKDQTVGDINGHQYRCLFIFSDGRRWHRFAWLTYATLQASSEENSA